MNLHGSSNPSANMGVTILIKLCQAKVRDFSIEILVQQHIACLDIAMHYSYSGFFMKIGQTSSNTQANVLPSRPVQFQSASGVSRCIWSEIIPTFHQKYFMLNW